MQSHKTLKMVLFRKIAQTAQRSLGNVAVLGASGGIGQPLSLLLKQNDRVNQLNLYDVQGTPGVAADLSHGQIIKFESSEILKKISFYKIFS